MISLTAAMSTLFCGAYRFAWMATRPPTKGISFTATRSMPPSARDRVRRTSSNSGISWQSFTRSCSNSYPSRSAQNPVLVAQHQQFGVLGQTRPDQHRQEAEQAPHQAIDERQQHTEMVPARDRSHGKTPAHWPKPSFRAGQGRRREVSSCRFQMRTVRRAGPTCPSPRGHCCTRLLRPAATLRPGCRCSPAWAAWGSPGPRVSQASLLL
jgi:hypothetical protein